MSKIVKYITAALLIVLSCCLFFAGRGEAIASADVEGLSLEGGVYAYASSSGNKTVRMTPEAEVSLSGGELRLRLKVSRRGINKANDNDAVVYIRIKSGSDTLWLENEENTFKLIEADGSVTEKKSSVSSGSKLGAYFSLPLGTDGTIVIPTSLMRCGTAEQSVSAEDYFTSDSKITFIEVEFNASRWDLFIGRAAFDYNNGKSTEFSSSFSTPSRNLTLLNAFCDKVELVVNGYSAEKTENYCGQSVTLGDLGSVYTEADEVAFFDYIKINSDLKEGYGITDIYIETTGGELEKKSLRTEGYVLGGSFVFRTNRDENTEALGLEPLTVRISVRVEKLARIEVINAGVTVRYGDIDDSKDGVIYLCKSYTSVITAEVKDGFDFAGLSYNGRFLSNIAQPGEAYRCKITPDSDGYLEIVGFGQPVTLNVSVGEGVKLLCDGKDFSGEYEYQMYTRLLIDTETEKGYVCVLTVKDASGKRIDVEQNEYGQYIVVLTGDMTIEASVILARYNITYDLDGGEYENGENPSVITYFDTVTLISPVKTGYEFEGWRIYGTEEFITELKSVEGDLKLEAVFKRIDNGSEEKPPVDAPVNSCGGCNGCGSEVSNAAFLPMAAAVLILMKPVKKKNDTDER